MTSPAENRVATESRLLSTRAVDLLTLPSIVLAAGISTLIAVAGADGSLVGRVAGLWLIWTPIGLTITTRGLRDSKVAARGNPFRRAGLVFGRWCGWSGAFTAAVIVVALSLSAPNDWMSQGLYIGIAVAAAGLLLVRGTTRRVGTGVLIACVAPVWAYLSLLLAALSVPVLATLLSAALSSAIERRKDS